jgi:hypothetical protein
MTIGAAIEIIHFCVISLFSYHHQIAEINPVKRRLSQVITGFHRMT